MAREIEKGGKPLTDYEILELRPGASQGEIKRAYFRLVRECTPEKDPERFQEIRRAYEHLKEGGQENTETLLLEFPQDSLADELRGRIQQEYQRRNYPEVMGIAQEAVRIFGPCTGFLYYLCTAQRREGFTGKAVKSARQLVEKCPREKTFRRELALACFERGYGKKAYEAFEEAYEMGVRDTDFLGMFAICCRDRKAFRRGAEIIGEDIRELKKQRPRPLGELINQYTGLVLLSMELSDERLETAMKSIEDFLYETGPALESVEEELEEFLSSVGALAMIGSRDSVFEPEPPKRVRTSFAAGRKTALPLARLIRDLLPDEEKRWEETEDLLLRLCIQSDPELSLPFRELASALALMRMPEETENQRRRFLLLDATLCALEDIPGYRLELEKAKEKYPQWYAKEEERLRQILWAKKPDVLREKLLKDYQRLLRWYDSGNYSERYPKRILGQGTQAWDSEWEGTYRRAEKKVGRNDPCPCGSGKKYKNCCGRNR